MFQLVVCFLYKKMLSRRLAVTSAMLEPFLEGQTLEMALEANRIFIVDLEILARLELDESRKVSYIVCIK